MGGHVRRSLPRMTPPLAAPLLVAALALAGPLALAGCGATSPAAEQTVSSPAPTDIPTADADPTTPSPASAASPSTAADATLAPATWDAAHVAAECTYRSATGLAMSLTDTGFSLGTVTFAPQPDSLCFFDGLAWRRVGLVDAPIRAVQLTGVGWFPSQIAHQDGASGRFLFGLTGSDDTTIRVTVDGTPIEPITVGRFSASTTELPILARIPATGDVVVTAIGNDGTVLESVTAIAAGNAAQGAAGASVGADHGQRVVPVDTGSATVLIATFIPPDDNSMPEALAKGVLTLGPDGCLYIGESGPAAVWKAQSLPAAELDENGVIHVHQGGYDVARVGDFVAATGGGTTAPPGCDPGRGGFETYILDAG